MISKVFFSLFFFFHLSFGDFCNREIGIENVNDFPNSLFSHANNYLTGPAAARMNPGGGVWLAWDTANSWIQLDLSMLRNIKNFDLF